MSWEIDFTADIYLLVQECLKNVSEVEKEIEELKKYNQDIKERMLMMLTVGVNSVNLNVCEGNPCDGVDELHKRFCELLNSYIDSSGQICDLERYKTYLEENKNGEA